jgi:hypothetical protein
MTYKGRRLIIAKGWIRLQDQLYRKLVDTVYHKYPWRWSSIEQFHKLMIASRQFLERRFLINK